MNIYCNRCDEEHCICGDRAFEEYYANRPAPSINPKAMNILLVIDGDSRNQQTHTFGPEFDVEEVRWEAFTSGQERLFAQQDAYVGDSIFPALFLNTLTVAPHLVSVLPDGRLYVSVTTK